MNKGIVGIVMAAYVMFGSYSPETLKAVATKRTEEALAVVRRYGGICPARRPGPGGHPGVPRHGRVMQTSAALTKLLGISFRTAPAVTMGEFDKLMAAT